MNRTLINWVGLTGLLALISYVAAMIIAPMAYPGYNWMEQAVSDLSAETAPSRQLWDQVSVLYSAGSVVCATCTAIFVSEKKVSTKLFRVGIYLFVIMNWVSRIGYGMFSLSDAGKEIDTFPEIMHMVVTASVVMLSIAGLGCLIVAGFKNKGVRGEGIWASVALVMMFMGPIGMSAVPPQYFGIFERFSVLAAVGYNAILGIYLFNGFKGKEDRDTSGGTLNPLG